MRRHGVSKRPAPRAADALLREATAIMAGLLGGSISVILSIALAAIIFSGPLAAFRGEAMAFVLFGSVVLAVIGAFTSSYRGMIVSPQDVPAVILSLGAASIAARMGTGDPEALFATVVALVVISSLLTALAFAVIGWARLGQFARYLPYPVMGGFLAAIGLLLVVAGLEMAAGGDAPTLEAAWRWGPPVAFGLGLAVVSQVTSSGLVVPVAVALAFAASYAALALAGVDLETAGGMGLLMAPAGGAARVSPAALLELGPALLHRADYRAVLLEAPAIATLVGLAVVEALLGASAIELATGRRVDLDREAKGLAAANALSGLGGGVPGYQVVSETLLAADMLGRPSRWIGVMTGVVAAAMLLGGGALVALLPVGVFAGLLVYMGTSLLHQWLWVERRRMPTADFGIVLLILALAATVGFLPAVAGGLVVASALFVIACARTGAVRSRTTGAVRLSTIERSDTATRLLQAQGVGTLIYELHGFIFFATASRLYDRIAPEMTPETAPETAPDGGVRPRAVILDFRRVQGVDVSAVFQLDRLAQLAAREGVRLILCHIGPGLHAMLARMGLSARAERFPTLDDALAAVEDAALAATLCPGDVAGIASVTGEGALDGFAALAGPAGAGDAATWGAGMFHVARVPTGAVVLAQGATSDSMALLVEGRLSARVEVPGAAPLRVATFLPGAVVGEIGFCAGIPRSATVVADVDSQVLTVTRAALEALTASDPARAVAFHALIAALLARRLARTTALLHAIAS